MNDKQKVIETVTEAPHVCGLCVEATGVHWDRDLQDVVCEDCRKHLRNTAAWLKQLGFHPCTQGFNTRPGTAST